MNLKRITNALKNRTYKYLNQRRGWTTDSKIVVIESDDWGSIRMPSKNVFNKLLKANIAVDKCPFNSFDSLAGKEDMELLFDLLGKFKDKNNSPAVITANSVVANPDFDKIRESGYNEYYFEPFTKTLKRKTDNTIDLWYDGIRKKVFYPQYHGREHLNVNRWLRYLRSGSKELLTAFDYEVFGISSTISKEKNPSFMAAFAVDTELDYNSHKIILEEGYKMFENIFDYKSKSFIAPNYTWNNNHETVLNDLGIKYLQGSLVQNSPHPNQVIKSKHHYSGEVNENDQIYMVRNCFFEPSTNMNKDWVDSCLNDINNAFKKNKPAIICSHRVNFIGSIVPENRDNNLKMLKSLLESIVSKWPNVEFLTSDQLGKIIKEDS